MKGGKTKVRVTHVPQLLPPTSVHPCVDLPHCSYSCTMACSSETFLLPHSILSLFHIIEKARVARLGFLFTLIIVCDVLLLEFMYL